MLILTRRVEQAIVIDSHEITVRVLSVRGQSVRLGIVAPEGVTVNREEIQCKLDDSRTTPKAEVA